ncbi:MAG: hypothetical protein ABFS86_15855, partial [Planctomycetota bacterium]
VPVASGPAVGLAAILERLLPRPFVRAEQVARLLEDKDFDRSAAARDLDFDPVGVAEGLARAAARRRGAA